MPAFRFLVMKKERKTPAICFWIIEELAKKLASVSDSLRNARKTLALFLNPQPHRSCCPRCPPPPSRLTLCRPGDSLAKQEVAGRFASPGTKQDAMGDLPVHN